jgi:hypothetical protein
MWHGTIPDFVTTLRPRQRMAYVRGYWPPLYYPILHLVLKGYPNEEIVRQLSADPSIGKRANDSTVKRAIKAMGRRVVSTRTLILSRSDCSKLFTNRTTGDPAMIRRSNGTKYSASGSQSRDMCGDWL